MDEWIVPRYLRFVEIVAGSIVVILPVLVLISPGFPISTQYFILSFVLLTMGIVRIIVGISANYLSDVLRYISLRIGIFELILAIAALLLVELATQILIYLLAFSLLTHGIVRAVIGGFARVFPKWLRGLLVVVGLSTIALSVTIFVFTRFGFRIPSVAMLSILFLLNGIARIALGIREIRKEKAEDPAGR